MSTSILIISCILGLSSSASADAICLSSSITAKEKDNKIIESNIIIDSIPGSLYNNGGRINFGPDNKLYIATGDASDPDLAQNLSSLAGKILRVNPDGSIPMDNPFKDSPIYSYGHRNIQGIAWHPETKQMYVSEHGPSGFDEINLIGLIAFLLLQFL